MHAPGDGGQVAHEHGDGEGGEADQDLGRAEEERRPAAAAVPPVEEAEGVAAEGIPLRNATSMMVKL